RPLVLAVPRIEGGLEPPGRGDEMRVLLWGRAVEVPERQRRLGGVRRAARAQQGDARGDGATGQDGTAPRAGRLRANMRCGAGPGRVRSGRMLHLRLLGTPRCAAVVSRGHRRPWCEETIPRYARHVSERTSRGCAEASCAAAAATRDAATDPTWRADPRRAGSVDRAALGLVRCE